MGNQAAEDIRFKQFSELFTQLAEQELFNGNISILENGEVFYEASLGIANYQTGELLNKDTVFELASVSKAFTAMAIMILQEQGKLDYQTPIEEYFPNLPYKNITIQNLLSHSSGLPDYMELFEKHWDHSKIAVNKDIVTLLEIHHPPALFEPNEGCEYSNTAYALLALIVEEVSGVPYAEFMEKEIFMKLGMKRTKVHNRRLTGETIPNFAFGHFYDHDKNQYVFPDELEALHFVFYLDGIQGDGVVTSTLDDMKKWDRALYTDQLVSKATIEKAFSAIVKPKDESFAYGNGWRVKEGEATGKLVYHGGSWPGYRNWFSRYIEQDKTIIYFTNVERSRAFTEAMVETIENILYVRPYTIPNEE